MEHTQRPREKALRDGIGTLSDAELAALILSSGNKQRTVDQLAHDLVRQSNGFSGRTAMTL